MAKVRILFNGASKSIELDEADAMLFIESGEARILRGYRVAIASPYNKAIGKRPERGCYEH